MCWRQEQRKNTEPAVDTFLISNSLTYVDCIEHTFEQQGMLYSIQITLSSSTSSTPVCIFTGKAHRNDFPERFDPPEQANRSQRPKIPHDSGVLQNK